jgi:hypothetical protein
VTADVDYANETLTRSQPEEGRGGFNGKRAADLVAHHEEPPGRFPQEALEGTGMGDEPSSPSAHLCVGSGASLDGRQPSTRWRSQTCRNRHRDRGRLSKLPLTLTTRGLFRQVVVY